MEYPFKIIESKISERSEFTMTDGKQPTHALLYVKEGKFVMKMDGGVQENVTEGDCVIFPDYVHFTRSVSSPIVFVYIKFSANKNSSFNYELPFGKINIKDSGRFISTIEKLESLLESDNEFYSRYKNHLINDILLQIISEKSPEKQKDDFIIANDSILSAAHKYISTHISEKISIFDICKASGTNSSTLNHRFRRKIGLSAGMFITSERMKKARQLLRGTSYGIRDIALKCGFDDVYYFSNAFKKHHGISPSSFRKQ